MKLFLTFLALLSATILAAALITFTLLILRVAWFAIVEQISWGNITMLYFIILFDVWFWGIVSAYCKWLLGWLKEEQP